MRIESSIPEMKQVLEQYFLLLNGKRKMKGNLDMDIYKPYLEKVFLESIVKNGYNTLRVVDREFPEWTADFVAYNIYAEGFFEADSIDASACNSMSESFHFWTLFPHLNGSFLFHTFDGTWRNTLQLKGGNVFMEHLPVADPHILHALWNDAGTVKVSAG